MFWILPVMLCSVLIQDVLMRALWFVFVSSAGALLAPLIWPTPLNLEV